MSIWAIYCKYFAHSFRRANSKDNVPVRSKICKRCGLVREVKARKAKV